MQVSDVIVVSLTDDVDRRAHIRKHFAEHGIAHWRFLDAVPADHADVKAAYREGLVAPFPSCFRCGRESGCICQNNILIPSQVANWLSFKMLWQQAAEADGLVLACEDDVWFAPKAMSRLDDLLTRIGAREFRSPFLLRLGQSGIDPISLLPATSEPLSITHKVHMSNVAHVLNPSMAALLLAEFKRITTTSDIWIHNQMAAHADVTAITSEPLLSTDLSYNASHARFLSRIHPKGITDADRERARVHVKRAESARDYRCLLDMWQR